MIRTTTLRYLEKAINRCLATDEETLMRLQALEGQVLQLNIPEWRITLWVRPTAHGVILKPQQNAEANTVISASLADLLGIARAKGDSQALFKHRIAITGNIGLAESLRHVMTQLDIDWESLMSECIGDTAAYQLFKAGKKCQQQYEQHKLNLQSQIKNFLQIESASLPTRKNFVAFADHVSQIRNDVERMEAKINYFIDRKTNE